MVQITTSLANSTKDNTPTMTHLAMLIEVSNMNLFDLRTYNKENILLSPQPHSTILQPSLMLLKNISPELLVQFFFAFKLHMPKHHETASYYIIIEELFLGCTGNEAFSRKLNICPFNHNATYLNQEMAS